MKKSGISTQNSGKGLKNIKQVFGFGGRGNMVTLPQILVI